MSYDFSMHIDCGGDHPHVVKDDLNYTYNVSPMYRDAMGSEGINRLDGKTGADCSPIVRDAIATMERNAGKYRAMNPANGWGDYEGALRVLRELYGWCQEAPLATIRVT